MLNSRMRAEDHPEPFSVSPRNEESRSRKLLCSYTEGMNYLLKKYPTEQAIEENDKVTLRYIRPSNKTPQQYADDLIAKTCQVADV